MGVAIKINEKPQIQWNKFVAVEIGGQDDPRRGLGL
jgi:hypothetical protein